MGVFKKMKLNEAKVGFAGGVYFAPNGQFPEVSVPAYYKVRITEMKVIVPRKGSDLFICETRILESDNPKRRAGSNCNWAVKMDLDAAAGNIKALLAAAMGRDPQNEEELEAMDEDGNPVDWDTIAEMAIEDEGEGAQPFKDTEIYVKAFEKKKKDRAGDKPEDFSTICAFSPTPFNQ